MLKRILDFFSALKFFDQKNTTTAKQFSPDGLQWKKNTVIIMVTTDRNFGEGLVLMRDKVSRILRNTRLQKS